MAIRKPLVIVGQDMQELPAADTLLQNEAGPDLQGVLAWADDPAIVAGTFKPTAGTIYLNLTRAALAAANGAIVRVTVEVTTAGVTLTGTNGVSVYKSDGTTLTKILEVSLSSLLTATGIKTVSGALSAAINPGDTLYLAVLDNGTTTPTLRAAGAATLINTGTLKRRATFAATTFPATIALSGLVATTQTPWTAIN